MTAVTAECPRCTDLMSELAEARAHIDRLTATVRDQARALAELTEECPPWAPSVACVYWLFSEGRREEKGWPVVWKRLRHLVDGLGDLPAQKLTPMAWDAHRQRRKLSEAPPCDATLNVELGRAKELLRWAVEHRMLKYSPLASARPVPTVSRRETRLTLAEVDRLVDAASLVVDGRRPNDDDGLRARVLAAFVLCCHDSMLRMGEARLLRLGRIGDDGRVELAGRETKGGKRRTVFLTPRTLEAIRKLPPDPSGYVFAEGGKPLHPRRIHYWFAKLRKEAGIAAAPGEGGVHLHDLRASGATTADEHGARATAIRDTLGHSRLATTEVYLRSEQSANARACSDVMVAAIRKPPKRAPRPKVQRRSQFGTQKP